MPVSAIQLSNARHRAEHHRSSHPSLTGAGEFPWAQFAFLKSPGTALAGIQETGKRYSRVEAGLYAACGILGEYGNDALRGTVQAPRRAPYAVRSAQQIRALFN
jgi:hypothetical protein